jgi:hypothetical protein
MDAKRKGVNVKVLSIFHDYNIFSSHLDGKGDFVMIRLQFPPTLLGSHLFWLALETLRYWVQLKENASPINQNLGLLERGQHTNTNEELGSVIGHTFCSKNIHAHAHAHTHTPAHIAIHIM